MEPGCAGVSRAVRGGAAVPKRAQGREWQRGSRSRTSSAAQSAPSVPAGGGSCVWAAGKELHGSASFLAFAVSGDRLDCVQLPGLGWFLMG